MENEVSQTCIKRMNSIDLVKLVMAFWVVAIHTIPLKGRVTEFAYSVHSSYMGLAVPFFFLSAGFLLANKLRYPFSDEYSIKQIQRYLKRMVRLYLIWNVIYFPLALYRYIADGTGWIRAVLLYVRGLIFVGEHYNSWMLWYLLSTIYALMLIIVLLKYVHLKPDKIVLIGAALFVMGIGITFLVNYEGKLPAALLHLQQFFHYTIPNGRIFQGVFYIPVGMCLAKKRIGMKESCFMTVVSFIMNIFITDSSISSVLIAVCAIGFFSIVEKIPLPDSPIFPFMRKMSTVIYFIHMYIWTIYYMLVYGEKKSGIDCYLVTLIVSIAVSACYVYLNEYKKRSK
ncbi:MAG: acyltransferase family protein [Lachnospiraceae bacterium]